MIAHSSFAVYPSQVRYRKSHKNYVHVIGGPIRNRRRIKAMRNLFSSMVQKCANKVILDKRKNAQSLKMDTSKKQ